MVFSRCVVCREIIRAWTSRTKNAFNQIDLRKHKQFSCVPHNEALFAIKAWAHDEVQGRPQESFKENYEENLKAPFLFAEKVDCGAGRGAVLWVPSFRVAITLVTEDLFCL